VIQPMAIPIPAKGRKLSERAPPTPLEGRVFQIIRRFSFMYVKPTRSVCHRISQNHDETDYASRSPPHRMVLLKLLPKTFSLFRFLWKMNGGSDARNSSVISIELWDPSWTFFFQNFGSNNDGVVELNNAEWHRLTPKQASDIIQDGLLYAQGERNVGNSP